jgi:hypothetical protein
MNFKKITTILLISVLGFAPSIIKAQEKISEGKAEFSVEFPTEGMDEQYKAMMPTEATIYFKNDKSRTEMQMAMMNMVNIYDLKDNSMITLMDMMGKKQAIKTDMKKEMEKSNADDYKVDITKESKVIAGYNCIKAIITGKDDLKFELWFTREIEARNSANTQFKGIDGFPMKYEVPVPNMEGSMKMECKSIKSEKVSDDKFIIPEGYEIKTQEEMKKQYSK